MYLYVAINLEKYGAEYIALYYYTTKQNCSIELH